MYFTGRCLAARSLSDTPPWLAKVAAGIQQRHALAQGLQVVHWKTTAKHSTYQQACDALQVVLEAAHCWWRPVAKWARMMSPAW